MYTVEVEIALDTGRPICIRNSDIDVEWPVEVDDNVSLNTKSPNDRTSKSIKRQWSCKPVHPK
jgi:hypothetical protein